MWPPGPPTWWRCSSWEPAGPGSASTSTARAACCYAGSCSTPTALPTGRWPSRASPAAASSRLRRQPQRPRPATSQEPAPARNLKAPYKLQSRIGTGYRRVGAYKAGGVVQQFYSDGLHGLSVFEQRGHLKNAETDLAGETGSGRRVEIAGRTMRAYSASVGEAVVWESDGVVYTAVDRRALERSGRRRAEPAARRPSRSAPEGRPGGGIAVQVEVSVRRRRRIRRRSRSEQPPQTPWSIRWIRAYSRHSSRTQHSTHVRLATSTPTPSEGKNCAGERSRQAA